MFKNNWPIIVAVVLIALLISIILISSIISPPNNKIATYYAQIDRKGIVYFNTFKSSDNYSIINLNEYYKSNLFDYSLVKEQISFPVGLLRFNTKR